MKNEEVLALRLTNRTNELNKYILTTIGKRIKQLSVLTPTQAQKLIQMLRYGEDLDKIANKIAEVSGKNIKDIYDIFEVTAKKDLNFAKQFYDYKGVNFIPYEENIFLQQKTNALARQTAESYVNFTKTTGFIQTINGVMVHNSIANTYRNILDKAFLGIVEGKTTFQEAMYSSIKELGYSGLRTIDYASGYSRRLDSTIRMNLLDGIRQLHNETQKIIGEEIGADGIEISVHENPAKDHEHIQGKQYSIEAFNKLNSELERPIGTLNCYHYIFSIILGISKPLFSQEELDKINEDNNKGFEIEGKKYTLYQGTQMQRRIETEIRKQKDAQIIAKESGNKQLLSETQNKITKLTNRYKEFSKISGLPTQMQRLRVSGYRRTKVK